MKSPYSPKRLLGGILSGTYTPLELREFAELCYTLALPLIRKKIALGRLKPEAMGLREPDLVYDCLADLFRRGKNGELPELQKFFDAQSADLDGHSDEAVLSALRHLIFAKVNTNVIRLYSELDPTLGRILRNIRLSVERNQHFKQITRFGEVCLVPADGDPLLHLPPMPFEVIQQELSRVVLIHDNIPVMLKKLHTLLLEQADFQRTVALVSAALLFKEIYSLEWEVQEEAVELPGSELEEQDIRKLVEKVCSDLYGEFYPTYVTNGKKSGELFAKYMRAVKGILLGSSDAGGSDGVSYYDCLRQELPDLTKESYRLEHRTVLEYLAKQAKRRIKEQMGKI